MKEKTQHVLVKLTVEGVAIEGAVVVPAGRSPRRVLLPVLRSLTDTIVGVARRRVEGEGGRVSCRKGCDACCRQMVPMAPAEAFALAAHLDGLPAGRAAPMLGRFERAVELLEAKGLLEPLRQRHRLAPGQMAALDRAYFAAQIACPFLEDRVCAIYWVRPLVCREYLVTSDAGYCAQPEAGRVAGVALGARVSQGLAGRGKWLPLVLAREYVSGHREAQVADAAAALRKVLERL